MQEFNTAPQKEKKTLTLGDQLAVTKFEFKSQTNVNDHPLEPARFNESYQANHQRHSDSDKKAEIKLKKVASEEVDETESEHSVMVGNIPGRDDEHLAKNPG